MKSYSSSGYLICSLVLFCSSFSLSGQGIILEEEWKTPAELKEPESVLYDAAREVLYVSNINDPSGGKDGNGSIGRVSLEGEILEVEWVLGGMDSPKGLGLFNDLLYVADLQKVVVINTKTGELHKTIEVEDAGMLNDITIDEEGTVYVSDSDKGRIYRIQNDSAELWLEKESLQKPNGLLAHQGKLYMIDMGTGIFYEVMKESKELRKIAEGLEGGDGIVPYKNDFIISNWNGEIHSVTAAGKVKKLLDTKSEKINAADIAILPKENLVLVPTFFANTLVAYKIK